SAETTGMSGTFAPLTYYETSDAIPIGTPAAPNPHLVNIDGNQLYLADGPNMSMLHPNANFVNAGSTSMSISLDLSMNLGPNDGNDSFFGFGVGATQAQAEAARFDQGSTLELPGWKGNQNGTTAGSGFADLFVAWERVGAGTPENDGRFAVW